jgi:hypothetical protein
VTDGVTALVWQQTPNVDGGTYPQMDWPSATAYCAELQFGAQTDWRLPSITELVSIANYEQDAGGAPLSPIDPTAFPDAATGRYWSLTPLAATSTSHWYLLFGSTAATAATSDADSLYVRCIRGGTPPFASAPAPAPAGRYSTGTGVVYDGKTSYIWQQTPASADGGTYPLLSLTDAVSYCSNLSIAGQNPFWRLPAAHELETLLDYTHVPQSGGAGIDLTFFPGTPADWFWSSSTALTGEWAVSFDTESIQAFPSGQKFVRCMQ